MQTAAVNSDLMIKLRAKGVSVKAIAERFTVPRKEVEEIVREHEPDQTVLSFAEKMEKLLIDAPNDYCRRDLARSITLIRNHHAASRHAKQQKIIEAIRSGAFALDEIADECRFTQEETLALLDEMIAAGQVEKRERGGVLNRGRKMKYHYHLTNKVG